MIAAISTPTMPKRYRRGSVYVLVLAVAIMLATIGLSVLMVARIQNCNLKGANDWAEAGVLAFSAVEYTLCVIDHTPGWRSTFQNGTPISSVQKALGGGTMSAVLVDELDGDLANHPAEPVRLYGIGHVGETTRVHSVLLTPAKGLPALQSAVHSGTSVQVLAGRELILTGGPASANATVNVAAGGIVYGDVKTILLTNGGVVTGSTAVLSSALAMPPASALDYYRSKATSVPYTGDLTGRVLGPGANPWGAANGEGIYYIDAYNSDLVMEDCRVSGTLIVRTGPGTLTLRNAVLLENYRSDAPVLLVDGNLSVELNSETVLLSEAHAGRSLNPDGAPYQGATDNDTADTYPNEIRGLVHVTGTLSLKNTSRVRGVVLCAGGISCDGSPQIICDRSLYENPPLAYGDPAAQLAFVLASWRWDKLP